jgi:hypothetical protein
MAYMWPDEGLDLLLGQHPADATRLTTIYLCLFTSQTATTVITHAQTLSNVTETTYTNYARQALVNSGWGAAAEVSGNAGRQRSFSQITFPTVGASGATINGAFLGDATPPTKVLAQANFDDLTAVVLVTNDVIKVTPTVAYLH